MKIGLLTTMNESHEHKRIAYEAEKLGHQFTRINLFNYKLFIGDNKVELVGLTDKDFDLIIVRGILKSIKPISAILKSLRNNGVKIFDNNFLNHEYSINKVTDLIKLAKKEIPVPKTYNVSDFGGFFDIANDLGYPVIVKSTKAGKGVAVFKANTEVELGKLVDDFQTSEKNAKSYILQEFIPYIFDIRALVIGSEVFAMQRIPKEGEFRANFSLGGSVQVFELEERDKKLAIEALAACEMTMGGVDILITKDGKRFILEVNHNAGYEGMEKATGENIAKIYLEHAIKNAK
jgi:RimK family alpha-L-glutamate ligase